MSNIMKYGEQNLDSYLIKNKCIDDCFYIENFANNCLKINPNYLLDSLNKLPLFEVKKKKKIVIKNKKCSQKSYFKGVGNWIDPSFPFMGFRGNELNRMKCFFYGSDYNNSIPKYYYTGFQYASMFAYKSTKTCPIIQEILDKLSYNLIWKTKKYNFNQVIVTKYRNWYDNIGAHQDKPVDITENSPILILTLCQDGNERTIQLTNDDGILWKKKLKNGSLLILGDRANGTYSGGLKKHQVKHEILKSDNEKIGERVSLVLRDIKTLVSKKKIEDSFRKHIFQYKNYYE